MTHGSVSQNHSNRPFHGFSRAILIHVYPESLIPTLDHSRPFLVGALESRLQRPPWEGLSIACPSPHRRRHFDHTLSTTFPMMPSIFKRRIIVRDSMIRRRNAFFRVRHSQCRRRPPNSSQGLTEAGNGLTIRFLQAMSLHGHKKTSQVPKGGA
ncbi:hypothetical protein BDV06DRAFT_182461 [Aspergillus oleicola]